MVKPSADSDHDDRGDKDGNGIAASGIFEITDSAYGGMT